MDFWQGIRDIDADFMYNFACLRNEILLWRSIPVFKEALQKIPNRPE